MTIKSRNSNNTERRLSALLTAGASALTLGIAAPALAQDVDEIPDAADVADTEGDDIVVVGSRIRRQGFENISQPAVVLDTEVLENRGFTNVADALNELPAFSGSTDGLGVQGQNVGQEFLNLFNLGTQRTLTVVNGRRFVPGNVLSADAGGRLAGSQVDINNFASPLIERVEILSVGGAPIYGADAVAGTVNIILKDDFEGAQVNYQFSDFVNPSGIVTHNVEAVFGANFADGRGNVTTSFQFEDQQGARLDQFPLADNQISAFGNGANPFILNEEGRFNILEGSLGFLPAPTGGVPLPGLGGTGINVFNDADGNVLTFAGDGRLSIFDPGTQTGSSAFFFSGGSGFDLQDFNELIAPTERFVFGSTAKYDVTDNVTAYLETNFLNSSSADLANQAGTAFNTAFLGAQGQGAFAVDINTPFIVEEDRQTLIDAGAGETFFLNGINLGFLPDAGQNFVDTTTFRVVGGVKGDFEFAGRELYFDLSANFGRTEQFRAQTVIRGDAFFNAVNSIALDADSLAQFQSADNLALLGDTTNGQGTFNVLRGGQLVNLLPEEAQVGDVICNVLVNPPGPVDNDGRLGIVDPSDQPTSDSAVRNCTPLNPFIGGGNSAEAIDFITSPALSTGDINQTDFLAIIGGDLIDLPAGTAQFSLAFERRRETGSFTSGGVLQDGLSRETPVPSFPGASISNNEIAVELSLPVLSEDFNLGINDAVGFNLVSGFNIDGAYRFINPSFFDNNIHIFTIGGTVSLLDNDLTLRGNRTTSVRQPSIVELFAPTVQTFDQTGDPCDITNIQDAGQARIDNCVLAAQQAGFSGAFFGAGTNPDGTPEISGGAPAMGLVLAPGDNVFLTPSVNAAIPLQSGGNSNLVPEINTSYTAGFIYSPSAVPGLTVGADYVVLQIDDAIAEQPIDFFTRVCFDEGLGSPECGNFTRVGIQPASDGSVTGGFDIVSGNVGFANVNTLRLQAIQAQARYNFDVADAANLFGGWLGQSRIDRDLGSLALNTTVYAPIVFRNSGAGIPEDPDFPDRVINQVGSGVFPEVELNASLSYTYDKFNFFWRSEFEDNVNPCFRRSPNDCDDVTNIIGGNEGILLLQRDVEHNASIGYQLNDYISIRGGVNNLLNNAPTIEEQAFGGGNIFGRSYFLRITARN